MTNKKTVKKVSRVKKPTLEQRVSNLETDMTALTQVLHDMNLNLVLLLKSFEDIKEVVHNINLSTFKPGISVQQTTPIEPRRIPNRVNSMF